jgi:hypothetical protein
MRKWWTAKAVGLGCFILLLALVVNGCGGAGSRGSTTRLNLYVPKPEEIVTDTSTGEAYVKGILLLYAKEGAAPEAIDELAKGIGGTVVGSIPQVRLYQVKVEGATAEALRQIAGNLADHPLLEGVYLDTAIETVIPPEGEEPPPPLDEESRTRLAPPKGEWNYDDVDWSEDNPNLWHWWRLIPYRNWYLKMIRAHVAWNITRGSRDHSKIAIIDGGFDASHGDLKDNIVVASQLTHPQNLPNWQNHGTAVAGLAAAVGGNGRGVCGVCWFASLRVFGVGLQETIDERGRERQSLRSLYVAALVLAADSGARVINMSLGAHVEDKEKRLRGMAFLRPAMLYAKSRDCLMVMAAGNDNVDAKNFIPQAFAEDPALRDYVLVVGACDIDGVRSSFSNYGDIVEIYAPGGNIIQDMSVRNMWTLVPGTYGHAGVGTSYAAPLVTGAAGLLLAVNPNLSAPELKQLLLGGATSLNGIRILNVAASVQQAARASNLAVPVLTANQTVFENAPAQVVFDVRGSVVPSFINRIVLDFGDGTSQTIQPSEVPTTTVQHTYRNQGVYYAELRFYKSGSDSPVAVDRLTINIGQSDTSIIIK